MSKDRLTIKPSRDMETSRKHSEEMPLEGSLSHACLWGQTELSDLRELRKVGGSLSPPFLSLSFPVCAARMAVSPCGARALSE